MRALIKAPLVLFFYISKLIDIKKEKKRKKALQRKKRKKASQRKKRKKALQRKKRKKAPQRKKRKKILRSIERKKRKIQQRNQNNFLCKV